MCTDASTLRALRPGLRSGLCVCLENGSAFFMMVLLSSVRCIHNGECHEPYRNAYDWAIPGYSPFRRMILCSHVFLHPKFLLVNNRTSAHFKSDEPVYEPVWLTAQRASAARFAARSLSLLKSAMRRMPRRTRLALAPHERLRYRCYRDDPGFIGRIALSKISEGMSVGIG